MSTARDQLSAIARDGAARFAATDLAHGHGAVTRRVRRDRSVRAGVTTLAGVGVVGAGTFGIFQLRAADATLTPASPSPSVSGSAEPTPAPSASTSPLPTGKLTVQSGERAENTIERLADMYDADVEEATTFVVQGLPDEAEGEPEGWILSGVYGDFTEEGGFAAGTLTQQASSLARSVERIMIFTDVPRDEWYDTVTIASIVQAEAGDDASAMSGVAAVIRNRLDAGMMLQIESPLAYDLRADERTISDDGWAVDTPYNTFMYEGLPPTPIGSPSPEALEAAITPADEDWLFFETDPTTGAVTFASTFHEHELNLVELGLLDERDVLPEE
ncbi:endolytic transglycosylase MltG [Demequina sp. NBRC 110051]|uniref:endolytic transglycosylase MltG n=1 Tax=Demequina sp. NBRC 110051 TaxID=1570340 RepID=UPI000A06FACD|nr:endolytic transglycosylase MltG [Demequina sp. NBRC 110051]